VYKKFLLLIFLIILIGSVTGCSLSASESVAPKMLDYEQFEILVEDLYYNFLVDGATIITKPQTYTIYQVEQDMVFGNITRTAYNENLPTQRELTYVTDDENIYLKLHIIFSNETLPQDLLFVHRLSDTFGLVDSYEQQYNGPVMSQVAVNKSNIIFFLQTIDTSDNGDIDKVIYIEKWFLSKLVEFIEQQTNI